MRATGDRAWERETDVVIVGSGFAGLAAGVEARDAGASSLILDKRNSFGGNSLIADGALAAAGTPEQAALGIEDSPREMREDMYRAGLGRNDPTWLDILTAQSGPTLRWLREELGCEFDETIYHFGGHAKPRCFNPKGGGRVLIRKLLAAYRERGGEALCRARFSGFLFDARGDLLGVELQRRRPGAAVVVERVAVQRAVVLASGGFAGDVAFRSLLDPRLDARIDTTNLPDTTAEALELAVQLGARTRDLEWIQLGPWTSPDERGYGIVPLFASYAVFPFGLIVDANTGRRFMNELDDRRKQADAMLALGQPCVGITDMRGAVRSAHALDRCLASGRVERFESLDALAQRHGLSPAALRETLDAFNAIIISGHDPAFGRPVLDGSEPLQPPYLATRLWPKAHYSMGGLEVDADARVIDGTGQSIPWLYAAGEVTGGTHGACRLSSTATTECLVQGRIAGRNAAGCRGELWTRHA